MGATWPVQQLEGVGVESRGWGGQAGTALVHPPTTPIPRAQPGLGYICSLWVLPGQHNSQSKRANADCANSSSLYTFFYSVIYNSVEFTKPKILTPQCHAHRRVRIFEFMIEYFGEIDEHTFVVNQGPDRFIL